MLILFDHVEMNNKLTMKRAFEMVNASTQTNGSTQTEKPTKVLRSTTKVSRNLQPKALTDKQQLHFDDWFSEQYKGGGYPANGLSARGASDIATQLRFEKSTPDELRWMPHLRPNPDWCDQFMGFPIGWSDYSKPLATTDHSFIEDTAIPRIIQGNIPASTRLKMLGNVCVPAQGKTAMEHLWNRLNCAELTPFLEALDVGNHPRKRKRA